MASTAYSTTNPNDPNVSTSDPTNTETTSPSAKPTKKKTRKKKNTPLYQETAVKYYNGFTKNKRFNKGINLSTGCAIFKTAWELPENNGLILPSRVIRHFKQVLPKKPKQTKTKKKGTTKSNTNPSLNPTRSAMPSSMATASIRSSISPKMAKSDSINIASRDVRSRTMVDLHIPKEITQDIDDMKHEEELQKSQMQQRRTIVSVASKAVNKKDVESSASAMDKIENLRDTDQSDEQSFDEEHVKSLRKAKSMSMANLGNLGNFSITLSSSITMDTPDPSFVDHADDLEYDLKPDTEELPINSMDRAETDVKHMDLDMVSFKAEMLKMNSTETEDLNNEKKEDKKALTEKEEKKEPEEKIKPKPKPKTTKKKKPQILYAEDATKLFKKINDGKRFKNGINLSKACNIFSVAWELPEENGRILPSKVARHFKQALPSKKTAKKSTKSKANKPSSKNIKPSSIAKARTNRDNATLSISITEDDNDNELDTNMRASTMRGGHAPNNTWVASKSFQVMPRASARVEFVGKKISDLPSMQPKKSVISHLEDLISADPNRSKSDDVEKNAIKRLRAGSMTDLQHMLDENDMDIPDDHVVENDIDDLYKEVKRQKNMEKKEKEKEQNVTNAIDAALGV